MSIFTRHDPNSNLWPHNRKAIDIDIEYYKNLPSVEPSDVDTERKFIRMFPLHLSPTWTPNEKGVDDNMIVHLVSEWIDTEEEADRFARAVEKHCYGITQAIGHVVYGDFHLYSIFPNWREDIGGFLFANWS